MRTSERSKLPNYATLSLTFASNFLRGIFLAICFCLSLLSLFLLMDKNSQPNFIEDCYFLSTKIISSKLTYSRSDLAKHNVVTYQELKLSNAPLSAFIHLVGTICKLKAKQTLEMNGRFPNTTDKEKHLDTIFQWQAKHLDYHNFPND